MTAILDPNVIVRKPADYKTDIKPIWCPGCGDYAVLAAIQQSLAALQIDPKDLAIASGIGCSSRLPVFLRSYGLHTVHGRALPAAQGIKLARPDLTVLAVGGDGDFFSIGAGHLPHAFRRDINITCIVMDNEIYGLTKGQTSPTTPYGHITKSTPMGNQAQPMRPLGLAISSGASFVARGFSSNPKQLAELIRKGMEHQGFSFIHVLSPCVSYFDTYQIFKDQVYQIPDDHNPQDRVAAMRYALETERMPLGLFYQGQPTSMPMPSGAKPFDTQAHLERYLA
ncbi:2-oxoacid:ferredoxin oxidoreductase subunit beta [Candidatus Oscillochloris fontis]|uniref:2-oxoacid:ferredoxin oxidoreductase subunit beta n=1 Tax=Candidatus Oscillochloris fontis TaxID=2496868 RepID=UPI00101DF3B8|nr:2-oxoacid:ferredoxin oxidoreductase subunit beta [Candidatus Oscillochloris fontis]